MNVLQNLVELYNHLPQDSTYRNVCGGILSHMEEAAAASEGKEPVAVHSKKIAAGKEISAGREKYKVCPSCGEKCSNRFAFCNMCGTKLS